MIEPISTSPAIAFRIRPTFLPLADISANMRNIISPQTQGPQRRRIFWVCPGNFPGQTQKLQPLRGNVYFIRRRKITWPTNVENIPRREGAFYPVVPPLAGPDKNIFLRVLCASVVKVS